MKNLFLCLTLAIFSISCALTADTSSSPLSIVNKRMEAYNNHDLEAFLSVYSDEIQIFDFPNIPIGKKGKQHIRGIFQPMFEEEIVIVKIHHQIPQGNYVINHETVIYKNRETKYVSIYEVKNGLIQSVQFVRE